MGGMAALQYTSEAYDTGRARLMGRHAAGESLLKAWVRYAGADPLVCYGASPGDLADFEAHVRSMGATAPCVRAGPDRPGPLADAGTLLLAGPRINEHAWMRRRLSQRAWSLVGVTHTTASHGAMDAISELLTAPVQAWDALICTSRSVRRMAEEMLRLRRDYLKARVGATRFEAPEMPVIPLGVHTEDFAPRPGRRAFWRERFGAAEGEPVVLHLGRSSVHAKANPLPMYMALQAAASAAGVRAHLVLAGWFANDWQEKVFREGAAALAPDVALHVLDGRLPEVRRDVWAGCDLFCMLVDNIQETFGLAPVEAMAAGLPAVVTDWDGFKDTVEHGVHGFRVRTVQPPAGVGTLLAERHEDGADSYDRYIAAASQHTAVDVAEAAAVLTALFADPERRRAMGRAAQAHARRDLDWAAVIPRYLELFAELERRRNGAASVERAPRRRGDPARPDRPDPFGIFREYPTVVLDPATRLVPAPGADAERLRRLHGTPGTITNPATLPPLAQLEEILRAVPAEGIVVEALVKALGRGAQAAPDIRGVGWLLKFDLLRAPAEERGEARSGGAAVGRNAVPAPEQDVPV